MSPASDKEVKTLSELAPAGFYIGLRIHFVAPEVEINHFPAPLTSRYVARGMALKDPLLQWTFMNCGKSRWSALPAEDPAGVMVEYGQHGLTYGCVISILSLSDGYVRTVGIFGRADREYTDEEMLRIEKLLLGMHRRRTAPRLTTSQIEALRLLADGYRYKRIAHILGITESAVKARLKSAVSQTGARTPVQALQIAMNAGLLSQGVLSATGR
ncbi:LuxR family transcriptional regulator [Rhodobacter sphaeroides]|jgi:Response regulator containing a CheY-like receiver domain and an HTH DNA-binding domain|uniref:DNA-binding HTH domain-containing proteins n=1 Tax=Cereibacter sphaeroides (strain ATCC 17023 / DSM 158 / JCM 6121 / CCUG 31486 / LMG 2827 / NBRC 12203 / NCIMB 8253 / ATH 2.4.1.) TaxID=272943 RepID=Q3IV28_CERS4|nr:LuxR family transcriptional regulator [Cereibacter sphaeroides]ABA81606.1 DNA-binding HTH domain-containing proteins [Cereibacter sphaeroides 2.4.1]AMJ50083.1 LuxR family transcriptional regulator [Cereibacter sphaeroides]ANS36703.1 LuxR family transcriptional regulator [Cereibacter sphaeroides]ATN65875.1 LuxR family transcriptional regulator [Cereibacter sphaeroides]AXC64039.1 LuxR family transcriptional regulator [Cereibacter sphaeroides 2.4.1]